MGIVLAVLIGLVASGIYLMKSTLDSKDDNLKMELKSAWPLHPKPIMSKPEIKVFKSLSDALPDHYIFSQVSLAQLIRVKGGLSRSKEMSYFGRYARMAVDFVVCDKSFEIVAGIEIDDKSHERADRVRADLIKNHVFKSAGLRLVRWKVGQIESLTQSDIKQNVLEKWSEYDDSIEWQIERR